MTTATKDIIRTCRFRPYRKGYGPTFTLIVWDLHQHGRSAGEGYGKQHRLGYRLTMTEHYNTIGARILKTWRNKPPVTLFEGEDFGCSPMHCIDSDDCIASLMGFLTLRPGDTDSEYFADYTKEQMEYCDQHAEALACEVSNRFEKGGGR